MTDEHVTKDICRQKHEAETRESERLHMQVHEHDEKLRDSDIRYAELAGDVRHIKDRIDNGLSKTTTQIKEKMDEFMPLVKESHEWANRFKQAVYYVAVVSFGGGVISLAFHLVAMITGKILR